MLFVNTMKMLLIYAVEVSHFPVDLENARKKNDAILSVFHAENAISTQFASQQMINRKR